MIRQVILKIRYRQPRVGARKLQCHVNTELSAQEIHVGRDRLIELLRGWDLLIRRRRNYKKTTNSNHRFKTYRNLIKEQSAQRPNEIFVSDITYINTSEKYGYLFLMTDQFSRKIVGYDFSPGLGIEGALAALDMALKQTPRDSALIHHSDRGLQYCSHDYIQRLEQHGACVSMTEDNHVYENALAERVNGILKTELLGRTDHLPFAIVKNLIQEAIEIYNNERLHMNLGYRTPAVVHSLN